MAGGCTVMAALLMLLVLTRRDLWQADDRPARTVPAEGAIMLLDEGRAVALSQEAAHLLDLDEGAAVRPALARRFGPAAETAAAEVLERAERTGASGETLLRDRAGRPYLMRLQARGAQLALTLSDLGEVAGRLGGPAAASGPAPGDPASATLRALLGEAPLLAWHRDGARVIWAEGTIRQGEATVTGEAAARMVGARDMAQPPPGSAAQLRVEMRGPDGERLPLQVVEIATPDGGRIGYAVDASGVVAAERTLTRFVQTMTETFAHLTVGLAIFDSNRRLALFNPTVVRLWQLDPAWLAERPTLREIVDALRSNRRIPEFRDFHAWRDRLLGLLDNPERADYEQLWTLSDGSTIRVLGRPHPHGSLAFIFDDVTERMLLEQRNRHMDDLIRSTLDRLHEGITVFSPDGVLRYVNDAFHEIWDTDEGSVPLDTHVRDLVTLTRRLSLDTDVWDRFATFATGEAGRRAWTARIELGSGRMLGARFAPLPDGSTMAIFADVTDSERIAAALHERNEALEAAEQMRAAVLDQISHRLRTPLNTVFGYGELLAHAKAGALNPRQQDYANGILEGASQLLDTISEVTELASLQLDPQEGEDAGQSIEDMLTMTRALLERRAEEARVKLALAIMGPVGALGCNALRLRQVVFNLVADAVHRCPRGGTVTLGAERAEDGTVAIFTHEPVEPGGADPMAGFEINSLTLSLVRRLVVGEGGTIEVATAGEPSTITVTCRFPDRSLMSVPDFESAG